MCVVKAAARRRCHWMAVLTFGRAALRNCTKGRAEAARSIVPTWPRPPAPRCQRAQQQRRAQPGKGAVAAAAGSSSSSSSSGGGSSDDPHGGEEPPREAVSVRIPPEVVALFCALLLELALTGGGTSSFCTFVKAHAVCEFPSVPPACIAHALHVVQAGTVVIYKKEWHFALRGPHMLKSRPAPPPSSPAHVQRPRQTPAAWLLHMHHWRYDRNCAAG